VGEKRLVRVPVDKVSTRSVIIENKREKLWNRFQWGEKGVGESPHPSMGYEKLYQKKKKTYYGMGIISQTKKQGGGWEIKKKHPLTGTRQE